MSAPPPSSEVEFLALLARAAAGDSAAFVAVIAPHLPRMATVTRKVLAGVALDDADDALQDALVYVLVHLPAYVHRDMDGWRAWLDAVARQSAKRHRTRGAVAASRCATDERALESHAREGGAEPRCLLRQLFAALPEEHRGVVLLAADPDRAVPAVMASLGVSESTARRRISAAREALLALVA